MIPNDLLGLGKVLPIDKLFDILSKSVGRISKPYFDKKDIDTKAYEIKKLAEARSEGMKIIATAVKENLHLTGGIEYKDEKISISSPKEITEYKPTVLLNASLEERTQERINYQDAKKQLNIENITAFATEELKNEEPVTNEKVDEGWTNRFFKIAEDISNEEMQALWGRILAGEIKKPKSFSLRTLELLRNLTKQEAECFMKFGRLAIICNNSSFIINFNKEKLLERKYNLIYSERLLLEELGLVAANDLSFQLGGTKEHGDQIVFTVGDTCVVVDRSKNIPEQNIPCIVFTKIGQELLQLIEKSKTELDYIQLLASKIRRKDVSIKYSNILKIDGGQIHLSGLIDVPLTAEEIEIEEQRKKQEEERQKREEERRKKIAERKNSRQ